LLIHIHNPLPNEIRRGSTLGHVFWSEAIVIPRSVAVKALRLRIDVEKSSSHQLSQAETADDTEDGHLTLCRSLALPKSRDY
jgi:hypothetical protein